MLACQQLMGLFQSPGVGIHIPYFTDTAKQRSTVGAGPGVKEGYSESGIKSFTETFSHQDTEQISQGRSQQKGMITCCGALQ